MSFCLMEGERYRISTGEFVRAERQLSIKFTCLKAIMTWQEYNQYIIDLKTEASDYWFGTPVDSIELTFERNMSALCEFGFMSDVDAMGFKLRWSE